MRLRMARISTVLAAVSSLAAGAAELPSLSPELIKASQEIDLQIGRTGLLMGDDALDVYLQSIANRLQESGPATGLPAPQVRAIKGAIPNAFALPDGKIYVTTELLIRLKNESQLATVLGHELAHYTGQHAQRQQRAESRRSTLSSMFTLIMAGLAGSALGCPAAAQSFVAGTAEARQMWMLASMSGYSQELEREADRLGFERLQTAGFDVTQAPGVFDILDDDAAADDRQANPKFASHPILAQRRDSYAALLSTDRSSDSADESAAATENAAWRMRLGDLPRRQLDVKLEQRDYAGGLRLAQRIASEWPDDARVDFLTGEFLRLGRQSETLAIEAYQRSVSKADPPAEAWRQLGYLHRRSGNETQAAEAFGHYLTLVPDAVEAPLLLEFMKRTATHTSPAQEAP